MKTAYFDLISGASGDMILGALVDAGLPFIELRDALNLLGLPEFELTTEACEARRVRGHQDRRSHGRHGSRARPGGDRARSSQPAGCRPTSKTRPYASFSAWPRRRRGSTACRSRPSHFHELGVVDTIVDVTGELLRWKPWGLVGCFLAGAAGPWYGTERRRRHAAAAPRNGSPSARRQDYRIGSPA